MKQARAIYLSENPKMRDIGFGFDENTVIYLEEEHIDRKVLYEQCEKASERFGNDFTVIYKEKVANEKADDHEKIIIFRGRKALSSVGKVYALREIHKGLPRLKDDHLGLPSFYKELASHEFLLSGGIFLIAGATGNGKSTTLAATLIHRLMLYGGFAVSIEDPPEYQMTGKIGNGFCFQLPVCDENGGDFAGAVKASLRMYPSRQTSSILAIGEIRDSKTAATALRESVNGHLIMATIHANDVVGAITRLLTLAAQEIGIQEASDLLAQSMRITVHQQIIAGKPKIKVLVNDKNNMISARIRAKEVHALMPEVLRQNNLIQRTGVLPLEGN
jgi:twitching motility protein PilT